MPTTKTPLVLGNWKMNPATLGQAKDLFVEIRNALRNYDDVEVAVAPPAPFISDVAKLSPSGRIGVMAQDVWHINTGPETGLISIPMVKTCGASYVILGHSEVRARGETDETIAQKVNAVHKAKLVPVVCVGESNRDTEGTFYTEVQNQLVAAFSHCSRAAIARTIIAYEPVWAIGSGQTASEYDIQEMRLFIEKVIAETFSRPIAKKVRIIYGGSVHADNAAALFTEGEVDGFLVGGASLAAGSFSAVVKSIRGKK